MLKKNNIIDNNGLNSSSGTNSRASSYDENRDIYKLTGAKELQKFCSNSNSNSTKQL